MLSDPSCYGTSYLRAAATAEAQHSIPGPRAVPRPHTTSKLLPGSPAACLPNARQQTCFITARLQSSLQLEPSPRAYDASLRTAAMQPPGGSKPLSKGPHENTMHKASMQTCSQSASNTDSLFPLAPPVLATGTKCSHKWHSTWDATDPPGTYSSTSCAPCPSTHGSARLYSPGTSFSNSLRSLARTAGKSRTAYLAVPLGAAGNGASASAAASAGWLLASALAAPGSWTLTCRGP